MAGAGSGREGQGDPVGLEGHSPFRELPPKTKLFWRGLELVLKREEVKSGKRHQGGRELGDLEGREKPLTCLLGSSRPA